MTGALAVGAGVAGVVGQYVGIRAALWVAAVGLAVVWIPIFFSPLRTMRQLSATPLSPTARGSSSGTAPDGPVHTGEPSPLGGAGAAT